MRVRAGAHARVVVQAVARVQSHKCVAAARQLRVQGSGTGITIGRRRCFCSGGIRFSYDDVHDAVAGQRCPAASHDGYGAGTCRRGRESRHGGKRSPNRPLEVFGRSWGRRGTQLVREAQ